VLTIIRRSINILSRLIYRYSFGLTLKLADFLMPKDKHLVVFGSSLGRLLCGNSQALFDYVTNHPCGLRAYYYLRHRPGGVQDHRCVFGLSWRAIYILLRARTFVSTHGIDDFFPFMCSRRTLVVNTWHGLPLKTMLFTDKNLSRAGKHFAAHLLKRDDVFVTPSRLAAWLFSSCFGTDPSKFFLCGQPRNDILFAKEQESQLRKLLPRTKLFKRVVLYCPTYRGFSRVRLFPFDDFDSKVLDAFLHQHNAGMLVRLHINDIQDDVDLFSDRVLDFGFKVGSDVNHVLSEVDVLITDYSSIYMDFLLTDKPIVFLPYDLEEYKKKRGLMFDDYDFWTPGLKPQTFHDFLQSLEQAFSHPEEGKQQRQTVNSLLNYYEKGVSCERVIDMIKELVGVA